MADEYIATTIFGVKYPNHLQEKAEKIHRNTDLEIAHGVGSGDNVIGFKLCVADYGRPVAMTEVDDVNEIHNTFIDKGMAAREEVLELLESDGVQDAASIYCVLKRV